MVQTADATKRPALTRATLAVGVSVDEEQERAEAMLAKMDDWLMANQAHPQYAKREARYLALSREYDAIAAELVRTAKGILA